MPKFSVIIPLYNKAPFICKALDSVIAQTFLDYELIVVDDGSTDDSVAICEEYLNSLTLSFVHSLIRQPNSGVAAARNRGVAASHGEFLCFLDADDWWEPTFLEEIDKLIAEYPDAGIYATNYVYYKPGKTHVALDLPRGYINYPEAYLKSGAMPVTSITTCMSSRVFYEMGGFPIGIKLGEDFLLWAKTAIHYKVAYCEKPLAYYNNDVPTSARATRNLHEPQFHMLFNLEPLEFEIKDKSEEIRTDWKRLLDGLRINGLMDYWLVSRYHDAAAAELKKVNWSKQQKSMKAMYEKPLWYLRSYRSLMQEGSKCKQKILKILHI